MRIGIDLDGVVYDFVASFRRYLTDVVGWVGPLPEPTTWNVWEDWGMSMEQWARWFAAGVEAGHIFRDGEPIEGAAQVIRAAKDHGHDVFIVTHREQHPKAISSTHEWLAEHQIPYDVIAFARDKTVIPVDVFIEDNVDNAWALEASGVHALLFDQPWNRRWKGLPVRDLTRAHDWNEIRIYMEMEEDE